MQLKWVLRMSKNSSKCKNDKLTFKMGLLFTFYPAKLQLQRMAGDHESGPWEEDKYTCQKRAVQPKENNDREETHKMFSERLFGFYFVVLIA